MQSKNTIENGQISLDQDQIQEEQTHQKKVESLIKGMRQLDFKNIVVDFQHQDMTWDQMKIPQALQDRLFDFKMDKPSKIQALAIPQILENREEDFLFQAANGSGKTLAFGIPAILTVDPEKQGIQAIIIANTRELIRQTQQVLAALTKDSGVEVIVGDNKTPDRPTQQILVTTPQWIENKVRGGQRKKMNLKNLKLVIYDEADEIYLQDANQKSIKTLNKHIKQELKIKVQTVLFSATYPPSVMEAINTFIEKPKAFQIEIEAMKLKGVKQFRITLDSAQKFNFIKDVYLTFEKSQSMIFTNKRSDAQQLQQQLKEEAGTQAEILTGQIDQAMRDKIIDDFRMTSISALICTNVLARGIDVPEVDLVINFDVPFRISNGKKEPDYANYLHRVGRTGRFGTDGVSLTIVDNDKRNQGMLDDIASYYDIEIAEIKDIDQLKAVIDKMRSNDDEDE